MKYPKLLCLAVLAATVLSTSHIAATPSSDYAAFPSTVTYRGLAVSNTAAPRNGEALLSIKVLDAEGAETLATETHQVQLRDGRFTVEVGSKTQLQGEIAGLRSVFASNPQVYLEVSIDGIRQYPNVLVQPRGHSPASIAVLKGASAPAQGHTKAYYATGSGTGVQAVALSPVSGLNEESTPTSRRNPLEIPVIDLGISDAVRDLPTIDHAQRPEVVENPEEVNRPRHGELFDKNGKRFGTATAKVDDSLAGVQASQRGSTTPPLIVDAEGIGNVNGVLPPDTEGAVGPNHYLQVINSSFRVFDKLGAPIGGVMATNTLWSSNGGSGPCSTNNAGDAIFLYDQFADKWVLTQFLPGAAGNAVCFAVSETPDPTGTYRRFQIDTQRFPDYFKVGVWPAVSNNAYFLTTNSGFQGAYDVYAIDRASMIHPSDSARPTQFFQSFPNLFMPADVDGPDAPSDSQPGLLYTFLDGGESYFGTPPEDSIELYEFDVDWGTPANTTFLLEKSFRAVDGMVPFNWTVCGFFVSNCLPQSGTAQGIDSASWWPMQRFVYRIFPDHEALVGAWTVNVNSVGIRAAPRWFELRRPVVRGSGWAFHQQGTYSPDAKHRFMPSVGMDASGNIAMGYSLTSSTDFPSIKYAVHESGSAAGTMSSEGTIINGTGNQTHSAARWGDYSSLELDPADDCTFWYTTEYIQTSGSAPWQTRFASFKIPGCGAIAADPGAFEVCSTVGAVSSTITLLDFFSGLTNLSLSGCPSGATCALDDTTLTPPGDAETTLDISGLGSVSAGDYEVTVTATDDGNPLITADRSIPLTLFTAVPAAPTLIGPANGATDVSSGSVGFSWTATGATSYTIEIATDPAFSNVVSSGTVPGTSYSASGLESQTLYYWRVKASNACGDGVNSATFSFSTASEPGDCPIGVAAVIHSLDDLEGDNSDWTSSGTGNTWQESGTRTHSGTTAFWAEDVAAISDQYLVSPAMSVPTSGTSPILRFWNYQHIESSAGPAACWDGAVLDISTNGGSTWTRLESELLNDPYDGLVEDNPASAISNENAWCGDPQDWLGSIVDLTAYAGDTVQFRFRLASDEFEGREGWYIDDLEIQTCSDTNVFADGFESGDVDQWSSSSP